MKPCCKKTWEETKKAIDRALFEVYFSPESKAEENCDKMLSENDRLRGYKKVKPIDK